MTPIAETIANQIINQIGLEAALIAIDDGQYTEYQADPVGFGEKVLKETYTDEIKALMESVRDNVITVAKSPNAVGKTHGAARVAVWWYKCFPGSQVYTAAAPPESNLKKLLWGEIGSILNKHSRIFSTDTPTNLHIERDPQSFLTGVTIPMSGTEAQREAKFSGKHAPHLLFILDEGDAIPPEVYKGIEACMSGGHARLLIMFNPRAQVGPVYQMERDRVANIVQLSVFTHPNVVSGEDKIPGAVTRETTVRRISEWCRPINDAEVPGADCFTLPDYLVGAIAKSHSGVDYPPLRAGYYKVMNPAFDYMVLGRYPAQAVNQLISREWISKARARWDRYVKDHGEIAPAVPGIMGIDVGEFGPDESCCFFRYGGYVDRPVYWDGVDTLVTGDRAIMEYRGRSMSRAMVDATGVGSGVAPYMTRADCVAIAVKVASKPTVETEMGEFYQLRDQIYWAVREWLRTDETAMLPPDETLTEELQTPTYEIKNGKIRVMDKDTMRELLRRSPNRLDGLALTFAPVGFLGECDFD